MRRAALALGVVALIGLGTYLARPRAGERGGTWTAVPEAGEREDAPAATALVAIEEPPAAPRTVEEPTARAEVAPAAPASSAAAVETPAALALSGTVVVFDEHGVGHGDEYGRLRLSLWTGEMARSHDVLVARGRWWTEIPLDPPVDVVSIAGAELGRRRAVHADGRDERFALPLDGRLALELRWPPETRLSVRDRASGRELDPVRLVESRGWPESQRAHPGRAAAHARGFGASPVALPAPGYASHGRRTFHARSPGYAWDRVQVDHDRGGEHVLLLDRAGDLEVILVGEARDPGARLRVYGPGDEPTFEQELEGSSILVEALAESAYRVRAEIGDHRAEPLVLGEVEVEVVAGSRTRTTLSLNAAGERLSAPLAGVLVIPAEWQLAEFALWLQLTGTPPLGGWDGNVWISAEQMEREDPSSGVRRWSAGDVQTGRYQVRVPEVGYHDVLDVGPQGRTDVRIEVAPPAEVHVSCIDAETGATLDGARVTWRGARPEGATSWIHLAARFDRALDRWICRVPIGRVDVFAECKGYAWNGRQLEVAPGRTELVLDLARQATLAVTLRDGDVVVSWDTVGEVARLEAAEGQDEYQSHERAVHAQLLHKRQPGLYRLTIPLIEGYEPVPDSMVRLERGETKELVVELRRAR